MTITDGYAELDEFKAYAIPGQPANAEDDSSIEIMIEAASRYIDGETKRVFFASTGTRNFDVPDLGDPELWLDDDLLSITTLTNGDGNTIPSTEYVLYPANIGPKYAIRLKISSDVVWEPESDGDEKQVIAVAGNWGYSTGIAPDIKIACLEITNGVYKRSTGENMDSIASVTAAGIVITPQDISKFAASVIKKYRRTVL